ncbi:transmembrane protein 156 [Gracilinanus agilis]|uniref:transmembrane protein 156 n=1 Tax=Gracilinanus agilis TaxID=191870 RepID=UPI001CFE64C5|nr:transmembrane protein 156 [Gracilinanus agilis]
MAAKSQQINGQKGNIVELSCFDLSSLNNFTYPLREFNISFVSFLQQEREHEVIILGISADHFHFHNMSQVCPLTPGELQLYSSCLVCESKGTLDLFHQELTTKASLMNESIEMKVKHFPPLPVLFNVTAVPVVEDPGRRAAATCLLKLRIRSSSTRKDSAMGRSVQSLNSCHQVSLQLEMEIGHSICTMKITWYVLVLSVFIFLIIFIVHKIFQEKRRVSIWKNQTYKSASTLLKGNDSEKRRGVLNTEVVSGATKERRPSAFTGVTERLPPISELEHFSTVNGEDQ